MDDRRFALCHARFFCRPNAGNGFEDISNYRKAGMYMNAKKQDQAPLTQKKKTMESWKRYQKVPPAIRNHSPKVRGPIIPRRTRRGC